MNSKLHLSQISDPKYYKQTVQSDVIVSGKSTSPFLIPKIATIKCAKVNCDTKCKAKGDGCTVKLLDDLSMIVKFVHISEEGLVKYIRKILELNKGCPVELAITEMATIEQLILIPDLSETDKDDKEYVVRQAYYYGFGAECNKAYTATIYSVQDPITNILVHVVSRIVPKQTFNNFKPNAEVIDALQHRFTPERMTVESIWKKLYEIEHNLSQNVTRIYGRPLLTLGVDLVFHSPLHFYLGNDYIHKGWGEILLLGDSQCGKGATCERLARFYGLGEVVSGENATFAGLVGGIQSINEKTTMLTWGRIVLNHGRLVIIDEISSLALDGILRKMSRIRSEGVSELDKAGVHARADACTRLIWISNPKLGHGMKHYPYGILAVKELIEANEDVARFDFVITALEGEVPSSEINKTHTFKKSSISVEDEKALLIWIWSRRADQIVFSDSAIKRIYELSNTIPNKYSPDIPLVQAENYRIKIAKVAAEISGRLCITDPPYDTIQIPVECVEVAGEFLERTYALPGLAYDEYSIKKRPTLSEESKKIVQALPTKLKELLIKNKYVKIDEFKEYPKEVLEGLMYYSLLTQYNKVYISRIYNERSLL